MAELFEKLMNPEEVQFSRALLVIKILAEKQLQYTEDFRKDLITGVRDILEENFEENPHSILLKDRIYRLLVGEGIIEAGFQRLSNYINNSIPEESKQICRDFIDGVQLEIMITTSQFREEVQSSFSNGSSYGYSGSSSGGSSDEEDDLSETSWDDFNLPPNHGAGGGGYGAAAETVVAVASGAVEVGGGSDQVQPSMPQHGKRSRDTEAVEDTVKESVSRTRARVGSNEENNTAATATMPPSSTEPIDAGDLTALANTPSNSKGDG